MPAPKRPNTAEATRKATEARIRKGEETMAEKLRAAGWVVIPPEAANQWADCQWCNEPHDGVCQCIVPCGAAYCHWADNP